VIDPRRARRAVEFQSAEIQLVRQSDSGVEAKLVIPFRLHEAEDRVVVSFGVNRDAARWGFDRLALGFDLALTHGFPVCKAQIEFEGEGYNAAMGWIQVVTIDNRANGRTWSTVDTYPMFRTIDDPFATLGHRPVLFDAPGPNPPRADERWTAESFLAVYDDLVRTRRVSTVCGFSWGCDLEGGTPSPFLRRGSGRRCGDMPRRSSPTPSLLWRFGSDFISELGDG
jgi:hypothetical protein